MSLRFALFGYGAWGQFHASAIKATPGAELVGVAARSAGSLASARDAHPGARVTTDYRELLAHPGIDAVTIATPNALHEDMAVAALAADKHVLLEKPMATTLTGCDRIIAAEQSSRGQLSMVHELRVSSQWGRVKSIIDAGRLGSPLYMLLSLWRRPFRSGASEWRYAEADVGSWLLEEPVHYVDLAMWYFESLGAPRSVFATGNNKGRPAGLYDNLSMTLRWPEGQYAIVTQTLAGFEHHKTLEVVGTAGAARALWSGAMDRTDQPTASLRVIEGLTGQERFDNGTAVTIPLDGQSGEIFELRTLYEHFVRSAGKDAALVPATAGRNAVAVCLAAEQSVREGGAIDIPAIGVGVPGTG